MSLSDIVQRGWDAVGAGDFDALDGLGEILPPGFEITGLRNIEGDNEVVSIVDWKSDNVPGLQLSVLFRFTGDKVNEERWFIDTEQWKSAF